MLRCVSLAAVLTACAVACDTAPRSSDHRGNLETARHHLPRDIDEARRLNDEALARLDAGRIDEARLLLERAIEADLTYGPARNNLGQVYFKQGELYKAAWEFQYAAKLMPNQAEPKNNLGLVFESTGQLADAVAHYRAAHEAEPDNLSVAANLARAKHQRGDRDEELAELLREIVLKHRDPAWVEWARERLTTVQAQAGLASP